MKKALSLFLAVAMLFSLAACGETQPSSAGGRTGAQNSVNDVLNDLTAPSEEPVDTPTPTATPETTAPIETETASATPGAEPTPTPTATPGAEPTPTPTVNSTPAPVPQSTPAPATPVSVPTPEPTPEPTPAESTSGGQIDVDLTALSSTMVYSEVYNMMYAPENYVGKTVKMTGTFAVGTNADQTQYYPAVLIADATACCSQGIEFVWKGHTYPDGYPEVGTEVTVVGEFQTYQENGYTYCHLVDAEMV